MESKTINLNLTETELFIKLLEINRAMFADKRLDDKVMNEYSDRVNEVIEARL